MIKIYHNPRCSKSREGLEIIQKSGKDFEIIRYLDDVPTKKELKEIIKLLGVKPEKLIRKNETVWKEKFKGQSFSDQEVLDAMIANPKLIERPIVVNGNKAVIGRPAERIQEIL